MDRGAMDGPAARWREIRERRVVHEDADLLALDKPAGVSVVGDASADDLMAMTSAAGEDLRQVHRIDKVTSGLVLLAKTPAAHAHLTRQFNRQTVEKTYLVVVAPAGLPERGTIELPLATGRKNRVRVGAQREAIRREGDTWLVEKPDVVTTGRVYPSTTRFRRLRERNDRVLLAARPVTGRRHQIRVHLAWIGHPIVGDPLFAKGSGEPRTLLHSWRLAFDAPDGRRVTIEVPPDEGFIAGSPITDQEMAERLADLRSNGIM